MTHDETKEEKCFFCFLLCEKPMTNGKMRTEAESNYNQGIYDICDCDIRFHFHFNEIIIKRSVEGMC